VKKKEDDMVRLYLQGVTAHKVLLLVLALCLFSPSLAASQVDVVTHHNDISRTGQNLTETDLTTSNVNVNSFRKLFARTVDGLLFAQPLYLSNLTIQGKARNVVFAATMRDNVYAFDADDPSAATPLWQVNLGTPVPANDICNYNPCTSYNDVGPYIGILSTSVIDPASGTIYVVAKTKNTGNTTYHFHLHALDVTTGAEKFGGPVEITGQIAGTGDGSVSGTLSFNPIQHLNRPGLLLMNGAVYVAFGSLGDMSPYHGWVFGYDAGTLQQTGIYNVTPNGGGGSVWQAGQGLLGLAGDVYFMTGNGTFDVNSSGQDYGSSIVKLGTSAGLSVSDYFTPYNQATLDIQDLDLGSGGPMALPNTGSPGLIVGFGKDGVLRLLDAANMGHFNPVSNNDVQEFQAYTGGSYFTGSTPIYWDSPNNGPVIYIWGSNDYLKSFKFTGSSFLTTPVSQGTIKEIAGISTSVPLSLSANGSQAGTGIVWASAAYSLDPVTQIVPGILRAFDATNLSAELWNSKQNAARDDVGNFAKFAPPTIANGKVYLPTFSGQLLVYGLSAYTVTPVAGTGGTISPATPQAVNFNTTTSFTVTPSAGYQTVSVTGCGGSLSGNAYTTGPIIADCTVSASFLPTYTVTFSAGTGGTITGTTPQTVVSGGSTTPVTAVPTTGYHLVNWTGTGGFTSTANPLTVTNVTANQTITANFAIDTFTVTPSAGTGGTISPNTPQTVNYNTTTSFTVTPSTGNQITSVTGCGGSLSGNTYTTGAITGDCTVSASFSPTYTVTFSAGSGGTLTGTTPQTVVSGGSTTPVTAVPTTGYHLVNWTGPGGFTSTADPLTVTNVTANQTITANFAINTYAVTPSAGTGGTISPATPQTVNYNATTSFTVTPSTGYQTASVTGCGGSLSGNTYTTGAITGNCTVSASFSIPHDGIVNFVANKTAPDIGDALKVFQFVVGATTLTDVQKVHADVAPLSGSNGTPVGNGGNPDIADVVLILRRVVGAVIW
jgi:hypothetical protein